MATTTAAETLPLPHGRPIPILGLGVFRIPDGGPCRRAVLDAFEAGYRHVDTAATYGNERDVGAAIRDSGLDRDDVFVTTKLWNDDHGYDPALRALDASLDRLGLEQVDLYLIHWPVEGRRGESWRALEHALEEGLTRAIGVSNYVGHHLQELLGECRIVPAVNQIELHPFNYRSRRDVLELCREHEIVVEAYSPLTKARRLDEPVLAEIGRDHGKSPAQVLLRYQIEKGHVVIPKSGDPERIRENAAIFDFELDAREMERLDGLDEGLATSWDPARIP